MKGKNMVAEINMQETIKREKTMFELLAENVVYLKSPIEKITYVDEEIVATFDSEIDAKAYIEKSLLKKPKDYNKPFKKNSLLWWANETRIRENIGKVPHNPII